MDFQRVRELAQETPIGVLCEAWDASPEYASALRLAPRQMTVQQAVDLASAHGLTLLDMLAPI